jgi:beta-glucosidase
VYYNLIRGQHGDRYADIDEHPRWAFGHGLSYSTFQYSGASLDKATYKADENITVTLTVTNKGPLDGTHVVQIYIFDVVASVTLPVQELKAFQRVTLSRGESRQISITLSASDLTIVTADGRTIVEPGAFELRIAQASDAILLKLPFTIE